MITTPIIKSMMDVTLPNHLAGLILYGYWPNIDPTIKAGTKMPLFLLKEE